MHQFTHKPPIFARKTKFPHHFGTILDARKQAFLGLKPRFGPEK
jgi:hypothetical protein